MGHNYSKGGDECEKSFIKECYLQKTNQFEALEVIDDYKKKSDNKKGEDPLGLGAFLVLDRREYEGKCCIFAMSGDNRIGIISEDESKDIIKYLNAGWKHIFECRICKVDEKGDENKRYSVAIFVKARPEVEDTKDNEKK